MGVSTQSTWECVAIEYTQISRHYRLCELHKDMPTHTVPVPGSACFLRPSELHALSRTTKPTVQWSPPPPPPPVVQGIPFECLARGCTPDGGFVDDFRGSLL